MSVDVSWLKEGVEFGGRLIPNDSLGIEVKDTGIGIPKDQQVKIFGKMFRAENAKNNSMEGNGLGLYLVKTIVEQSGGLVWFVSVENKGTSFYAILPKAGMAKREGEKRLS